MPTRKEYSASLSDDGQALIALFNAVTAEEQSLLVDILYDALYGRNLRLVLAGRLDRERVLRIEELEETVREKDRLIGELKKRPRNLDIAYADIPGEERRELKKEVVHDIVYRDTLRTMNQLREENRKYKERLRELGVIF